MSLLKWFFEKGLFKMYLQILKSVGVISWKMLLQGEDCNGKLSDGQAHTCPIQKWQNRNP